MTIEERRELISKSGMAKRASDRINFPKLYCSCRPVEQKIITGRYDWSNYVEYCDNCKLLIRQAAPQD